MEQYKTGNLFELARVQLRREIRQGKRKTFTDIDNLDYAIKIRKWLDRRGGNIQGIFNQLMHTRDQLRRLYYLNTGR
jgi:hypothetical protein